MAGKAYARKHRPFQLEDVVGQRFTIATLKQASIKNQFAQAYLFCGKKGCGKTSLARITANLLTCENVKDGRLCGKCRACKTIPNGRAMDVIELDGAKNRKVEDIQNLINGAQWSPNELKKKVYIIDECHQLTNTAISALLKIVEEPPDYLTFIFCTTEPNKVIDTICSRSQRFIFHPLSSKEIALQLLKIAELEEIRLNEDASFSIAQLGRGSMRDAIGCLEQISTLVNDKLITNEHVKKFFGLADSQAIFNIIQAMINSNVALVLDQANDMIMASASVKAVLYELSEAFRNIALLKAYGNDTHAIDLPDMEIKKLQEFGKSFKFGQLSKLSKLFSTIQKELEYSINERWILESNLINCVAILRK